MRKRFVLFIVLLITLVSSCIPNKDLVYFQGEPNPKSSVYKIFNEPYKLQVNDILDIRIKADDEKLVALFNPTQQIGIQSNNQFTQENLYFNSYTIDRHGNVRIPYVGDLNVLGYTEKEVREKIEDELGKFFKDTGNIFVTAKLAGIRFTVLGEVARPGTLVLFQNQVNIVEAIANAGDISITGNRKRVTILRKNMDGTKKFKLDLTNVSALDAETYYIQSNDIVYVEPLKQKSWGTGTTGSQTFSTIISVLSLVTTTFLLVRNL